jgi:hypothetical protein
MKRESRAWGYHRIRIQVWGVSNLWDSKVGSWVRGTRTREWLSWRGPAAIVNNGSVLSSERMLQKDYNRKCWVKKRQYWSWVSRSLAARRTDSDSDSELSSVAEYSPDSNDVNIKAEKSSLLRSDYQETISESKLRKSSVCSTDF